jgi:hypothetical protein
MRVIAGGIQGGTSSFLCGVYRGKRNTPGLRDGSVLRSQEAAGAPRGGHSQHMPRSCV